MRQIIYIRTLRIWDWSGTDSYQRTAPGRIERNVTPWRAPRDITPLATSRRIPVHVRHEGWLDRARRSVERLSRSAGAWMRSVAKP
ncbi:MAG: hypothetical protein OXF93_06850 [Acidobacteria bacterium]|nr:hypothetical protein [Acidobacteriota bacterium]